MHDDTASSEALSSSKLLDRTEHRNILSLRRECQAMEARLKESEEKFRFVSETAVDAIIVTDIKGDITFWNRAAEKNFWIYRRGNPRQTFLHTHAGTISNATRRRN